MARTKTNAQTRTKHAEHQDAADIQKNFVVCLTSNYKQST